MTATATSEDTLISVTYLSTATRPFTNAELAELLATSRRRNAARGVTGILLYKDGSFAQVLEGPAQVVDALYDKIRRDRRHRAVTPILRRRIDERLFGDCSMAFYNVEGVARGRHDGELEGASDFFEPNSEMVARLTAKPNHALTMLLAFRDAIR